MPPAWRRRRRPRGPACGSTSCRPGAGRVGRVGRRRPPRRVERRPALPPTRPRRQGAAHEHRMRTPRGIPRNAALRPLAVLRWLPTALVLLPWLLGPRAPAEDIRIRDLSSVVSFRLLDWETLNVG